MFGQYTTQDTNTSDDGMGRKVLYCNACKTAEFDGEEIIEHVVGKKTHKLCPYCTEHLTMRSVSSISQNTLGKPIGDLKSKHTWVVRLFDTPWGKLRFMVSTQMYQCYQAYFMPMLLDSGKRDQRGNHIMHIGNPVPTAIDTAWYYPPTNAAMVKELINADFSDEAIYSAWQALNGEKVGLAAFARFMDELQAVVHNVHVTVNPQRELDLGTVNV